MVWGFVGVELWCGVIVGFVFLGVFGFWIFYFVLGFCLVSFLEGGFWFCFSVV